MKVYDVIITVLRLWLFATAFAVISCTEEIISAGSSIDGDKSDIKASVSLSVTITHPDALAMTRVMDDYELDLTAKEAALKSISIFVVDLDDEGNEIYPVTAAYTVSLYPADFIDGQCTVNRKFSLSQGKKHVYVGGNMQEAHIQAFTEGSPFQTSSEEAVSDVMTDPRTHMGEGTDILMFSQALCEGSEVMEVDESDTYYLTTTLKRTVSKVLVVYKPHPSMNDFLTVEMGNGWAYCPDVRYTLNVTNRRMVIQETEGEGNVNMDANWLMGDWVDPATPDDIRNDRTADYLRNFRSYGKQEIDARMDNPGLAAAPVLYDESRIYIEGLYCLENTVYDDVWNGAGTTDKNSAALLTTTHLVIRLKFVPVSIIGADGVIPNIGYISISEEALKNQSEWMTGTDGNSYEIRYEDGTFWFRTVDGVTEFYNIYGLRNKLASDPSLTRDDFQVREGGKCYYATFVEGDNDGDNHLSYESKSSWGLSRNTYYIVTIEKITGLGSGTIGEEFMEVNSETMPWVWKGKTSLEILPR